MIASLRPFFLSICHHPVKFAMNAVVEAEVLREGTLEDVVVTYIASSLRHKVRCHQCCPSPTLASKFQSMCDRPCHDA